MIDKRVARRLFTMLSLLMLCLAPVYLRAQLDTGEVAGTITDASGAVVTGTDLTLKNTGTNAARTTRTAANGAYSFRSVPAGIYELSGQSTGFQPIKQRVEVTVGGHATLDIKLAINGAEQTVTVVGEGGTTVNTTSQEVSQIVSSEQVSQLPSLTRNPYDFISISGNISSGDKVAQSGATSTVGDQNTTTRGVGYSLNGQRPTGTEVLLDGVENNDTHVTGPAITVPLDSVDQYRIVTSNFGPEYGRASGGVVDVITKAGTNRFHGGAWEFNRLSAYTSNTVQNAQSGNPKGKYTRNQFGYDIGGPILKDKLFFFQSTEWARVRGAANLTSNVVTPEFLAASAPETQAFFAKFGANSPHFTKTLTKNDVTANGAVTPTPGGPFDKLPGSTPIFGVASFSAPANSGGGSPQNTYYLDGRIDFNLSQKTQMFFRGARYNELDQSGALFNSPYSQYNVGQALVGQAYLYSLTHQFSPSLLSSTKLSFTRNSVGDTFNTALRDSPVLYLYNNATIGGNLVQLPGFFDQFEGVGGLPAGGPQNTVQINEDFDVSRGRHSLKLGTQLFYIQNNITYGAYAQAVEGIGTGAPSGLDNFLTGDLVLFQAAVNPQGALPCVRNYATGALVVTPACSINLPAAQPQFSRSNRFKEWALYADDSYKITPRLNINYGVRYDHFGVQHNNNPNLESNFYYGKGATFQDQIRNGQVFTTPNSPTHGLWEPSWGTVSPRVGFALDVTGDGRTSLRGGYGIAYERNFGNVTFNTIQNPPNYATLQVTTGVNKITTDNLGPLGGSSGSRALPPTSLRNVAQNIRTAQTQFYSLTVERELKTNVIVSLAYVGSRGTHLYDIKNYNMRGTGNVFLGDPIQDATGKFIYSRLNNQYGSINNRGTGGDAYYNGMNAGFQMNDISKTGLAITANYTYAHSTDNISSTFSESNSASNGVGNLGYLDPFNPGLDHGSSDFDIRHRFVFAPIYQTPWFRNGHSWKSMLLGNYLATGIYTVRTGTPFTFSDSSNSLNAGVAAGIPRYTPSALIKNRTFTGSTGQVAGQANTYSLASLPAAVNFSNAALGGISDFGPYPLNMTTRNAFRGPGAWNFDLAASKSFPIREGITLELRAEGFDIFNHHNLYVIDATNDVANYGYVTNGPAPTPISLPVQAKKGGVNGGANDERRFGQFALKLNF